MSNNKKSVARGIRPSKIFCQDSESEREGNTEDGEQQLRIQQELQKKIDERDQEIIQLRLKLEETQKQAGPPSYSQVLTYQPAPVHQSISFAPPPQYHQPTTDEKDYDSLKKTIYGHAKMENFECQKAVAFVILNRARANQEYWGGQSITAVCRKPGQFWPWNNKDDVHIDDWNKYNSIDAWLPQVLNGQIEDNTNGSDHLLPNWEKQDWLSNVDHRSSHGNFNFYKSKWLN